MPLAPSRRPWLAFVLVLAPACGDDSGSDGDSDGAETAADSAGDSGDGGTSGAEDDGGTGGGTDGTGGEPEPEVFGPVVGVPNLDDDNRNGQVDWFDGEFVEDNDLGSFSLPQWYLADVGAGDSIELTLAGELDAMRFWRDGVVVLGHGGDVVPTTLVLGPGETGVELTTEFAQFLRYGTLTVRHLDGAGTEIRSDDLPVLSSPLLTNHHLQPAEHVWAVSVSSNSSMIGIMSDVLGNRFTAVGNMPDVWMQDELEWATATAPGQRLNIAMDSIRDRQLDAFVKGLRAPDVEPMTWGNGRPDTTEDKFGNLETTPPHTARGIDYPLGRIYYGAGASCGPNTEIRQFLAEQRAQEPIEVDTCWLCVGHVDEFLSFIPDPSAAKGFRFLISDVDAAYAVLETVDPATSLPRYAQHHGYSSVGAILGDAALRALNDDIQRDYLDPVREQIKAELELDDSDIIRLPGLFERLQCPYKSNAVAAMIPGMLNLMVANFPGEPLRIFVSDPFLRPDAASQASDPLIAQFRAALPAEYEIHFVDDWYTYHVAIGEVHCGSNVSRTPSAQWWTDAMHLLGGG